MAEYVVPQATEIGTARSNLGGNQHIRVWDPPLPGGRYGVGHFVMDADQVAYLVELLHAALGQYPYLARLDHAIRRLHGQSWNDEAARQHQLSGLVAARNLYTHPGERRSYRAGLAEALGGELPIEPVPAAAALCEHDWPADRDGGSWRALMPGEREHCARACGTSRHRGTDLTEGVHYDYPSHPLRTDPPRPLSPGEQDRWTEVPRYGR